MSDTETLEWLVWFARKSKGTVAEVTQRALDQNPYLLAAAPRSGEGLREAAQKLSDRLAYLHDQRIDLEFPWEAEWKALAARLRENTDV